MKWLIDSGVGTYIIPMIMIYLNLDDFAEMAAAATVYSLDLTPYLKNSPALTNTVIFKNHFQHLSDGKQDHPIIDFNRLWQLSTDELLIEIRTLNLTWKPLYKTDIIMPFLVERCVRKPLVSFNPIFDVMALVEKTHFYILSYGGYLRTDRGQLIYAEQVGCDQVSFLSWNPTGTYLLACFVPTGMLQHFCDRQLVVYKFIPQTGCLKKFIIPAVSLRGSGTMLTPCIWLNETSFLWCSNPTHRLLKINIIDYNKNTVTITTLADNVNTLFQLHNGQGGFICIDQWSRSTPLARSVASDDFTCEIPAPIFGNFFALPCEKSSYLFCILRCPTHANLHDCIGVIDKVMLKITHIIAIPGQLQEIKCNEKTIYALFSRCNNITEPENVKRVRSAYDFSECPYHIPNSVPTVYTWWDNKQTDICWFTDDNLEPTFMFHSCCPIETIYHKNRSYRQRCLFDELCDSRSMQLTKDFILLTNFTNDRFEVLMGAGPDIVQHQRIFLNHHYTQTHSEVIAPSALAKTIYYHPTKGVMFVHEKQHELYYPYFGLSRSARLNEFLYFPEFDYNIETNPPFNYPIIARSPSPDSIIESL